MSNSGNRRTVIDAFAASIVTTAFGGLLTFISTFLLGSNGTLTIGERIAVPGPDARWVIPLELSNYRTDGELSVRIEVPRSVDPASITSSRPITISLDSGAASTPDRALLHLSDFPSSSLTRILVPVDSASVRSTFTPRNASQSKIDIGSDGAVQSRLTRAVSAAMNVLLPYALVAFALNFVLFRIFRPKIDEMRESVSLQTKRMEKLEQQVTEAREAVASETKSTENRLLRVRVLLLGRLSDLRREVDFYRDTFRSLVVKNGGSIESVDEVLRHVTARLGTWTTQSRYPDEDAIRIAASMLEKSDEIAKSDRGRIAMADNDA